ncbi:DNA polymerase I [Nosocomiicoccus sp. HMSC059G07]|uniref:DNA polymerase I n=1 Tax=Nosocomiicoccus sp. HMSC059G07 TaxID=1739531 RepID=UPI0008A5FA8B|nr:DNA polymerase I [Nosocomiicoccus sp. HMSC059G07]OFO55763.1 DNA polymerase I [Nosocomiicoccus sp. HMSC059G07]
MDKLILIDGNSLAFRAFYGLPLLSNQSGLHTNAIFGFQKILDKIIREENPTHFLIAFDAGKKTFRHEKYGEYKGGRQKTPPELGEQFAPIRKLIDAYGIKRYEEANYEADDIIGSLSKIADENGMETIIVTGDRDLTQLASEHVTIYFTKKGVTQIDKYTPEFIEEEYGLRPEQIIDMKGLWGDTSDNIPGVPGIGEKTAIKLLKKYDSVEGVYEHIEELKGKQRENLENFKDDAFMSKELATIYRDMTFKFSLDDLKLPPEDVDAKIKVFKEFEFNSLLENLNESPVKNTTTFEANRVDRLDMLGEDVSLYLESEEANYLLNEPTVLVVTDGENSYVIATEDIDKNELEEFLKTRKSVNTYDLKRQIAFLNQLGVSFNQFTEDIMLGAFLLDPGKKIEDVSSTVEQFNIQIDSDESHYGKGRSKKNPTIEETKDFTEKKALAIHHALPLLEQKLKDDDMFTIWKELEIPLSKVLSEMEIKGITVDINTLKEMETELEERLDHLKSKIYEIAGEEFNINSPKQLGVVLFEHLELPVIKKTKTGYSTAADVLEALRPQHEIIDFILEYREIQKLQSTYVIGLQGQIHEDGRIHTRFNQTLAQTGRLSSVEPNLQNIPIRLEEGRKIRKAFVPKSEENVLLSLDYSQIELRVLASISKDEKMIDAFKVGKDIHTTTAANVYNVDSSDVTSTMRSNAKAVNFGIVYGISDYGLSQQLGITRKEAKAFIDTYLDTFVNVKEYMKYIVQDAKRDGYVSTLLGRRRYVPDINSRNFNARSFSERIAMNSPIQGTAADIIKLAMVNYYESDQKDKFNAELLLQIHDELVFDIPKREVDDFVVFIKDIMEHALEMEVPLKAEYEYGPNWYTME